MVRASGFIPQRRTSTVLHNSTPVSRSMLKIDFSVKTLITNSWLTIHFTKLSWIEKSLFRCLIPISTANLVPGFYKLNTVCRHGCFRVARLIYNSDVDEFHVKIIRHFMLRLINKVNISRHFLGGNPELRILRTMRSS